MRPRGRNRALIGLFLFPRACVPTLSFPFSPCSSFASFSFLYPRSRAKSHAARFSGSRQGRAAGNTWSRRQDRAAHDKIKPIKT